MKASFSQGMTATLQESVSERLLVPGLFPSDPLMSAMPPVLATAWLVALMERACIAAASPHLDAGEATVGTRIDVRHLAATPIDFVVTIDVICTSVNNRHSAWTITARDGVELIGEASHERFVVDSERFSKKLGEKISSR